MNTKEARKRKARVHAWLEGLGVRIYFALTEHRDGTLRLYACRSDVLNAAKAIARSGGTVHRTSAVWAWAQYVHFSPPERQEISK